MRSIKYFACILLSVTMFFACASVSFGDVFGHRSFGSMPGPTLLYPTTEVSLTGKDALQFRWERTNLISTRYFIFKLYKGYNTTQENLLKRQNYFTSEYPITIPASEFEVGQVYTWVLTQVFMDGEKSDRSFVSFKVVSK